jgi:hypothetical protein
MTDNVKKRTSRSSKESVETRNKPWTPPSSLDAPRAPQGYAHRWIRVESAGFMDTGNVSKKTQRRLGICSS